MLKVQPIGRVASRRQGALFEEGAVQQVRAAGLPLVLHAEEQVPEVDASDALTGELPGPPGAGAPGRRQAGARHLRSSSAAR